MDAYTAIVVNRIFGNALWSIFLIFGLGAIVYGARDMYSKKINNRIINTGLASIGIFLIVTFVNVWAYAASGDLYVTYEYEIEADISSQVISDHTVRYTNNEETEITINKWYKVEYYVNGHWYNLRPECDRKLDRGRWLNAAYLTLEPGEESDAWYNISTYGELRPGHYRLASSEDQIHCVYTEFDIDSDGCIVIDIA